MSLRTRLALQFALTAGVALTLALGASLAVFALRVGEATEALSARYEAATERRLREAAERALAEIEQEIATPLLEHDRMALARTAMEALARSQATAVRVYDGFGRTVADGGGDPAAFDRPIPPEMRALGAAEGVRHWTEGGDLFAGRAVCAGGDCIGWVAAGVDGADIVAARAEAAAALEDAKTRFWAEAALLGGAGVAAGALVAALIGLVMARRLVGAVRGAVEALERLAAGDTEVKAAEADAMLRELNEAVEKVAAAMQADPPHNSAAIIADMAEGLFVAEQNGAMTVANPALHALLKAEPETLIGADVFKTFGATRVFGAEAIAETLGAVTQLRRADGGTFVAMVSARASGEGATARVVGSARDVTEAFGTAEALKAAQTRADAAEKAKHEFLSVMSHELRTPLNGILGGAAVLAGTDLNDAQKGFLKIVQTSGKSMLSLVTDLLDVSAAETATPETLERQPVDLEAVAHEVARRIADMASQKELDLYVRVQPGAPVVLTDGDKLVEIGSQFADNAVKFTDAGSVGVDMAYRILPDGEAEVTLTVHDSGPGVPPEQREAMFAAFARGDSSAIRAQGGAGLGLAIAQKLSGLLGGGIDVCESPEGGAAFSVRFPAPIAGAPGAADAPLAGRTVMVVDPSPGARAALAEQFAHAGARVIEADGPAAAVDLARYEAERGGVPIDLAVHPREALDGPGAAGFREWIEGDGWAQGVASVALRPEGAPLSTKELPQRMQQATRPPKIADLLEAAERALKAADRAGAEDPFAARRGEPAPEPDAESEAEEEAAPLVLLVDSNEVNRIVLSAYLKKAGFDCATAEDGEEALERFRARHPKLVLLDLGLSGMTGAEAAGAMRRHEGAGGLAQAPIIGLVGKAGPGERERATAAGVNDFLPKPVKTAELEAKLERWTTLFGHGDSAGAAAAAG